MSGKFQAYLYPVCTYFSQLSSLRGLRSSHSLAESVSNAVQAKAYEQIPDLLNASRQSCQNPNPFLFLSNLAENAKTRVVDEMLQSFISIRPRSRPLVAYSCLLLYTLQSSRTLPLGLVIVQRMLRSGCFPVPQTHLLLSKAWLERRRQCQSVSSILLEMKSVGYDPDSGTCNYLISSLCKVDHINEAVRILKGMSNAGCVPDLDSYGSLIGEMCELRMIEGVLELIKEMVGKFGLNPRQEMIVKALAAICANKEIWRAVEVIEFLESKNVCVCFEGYELVLEGCLEIRQVVLGAKVVMKMTERGFIPYIKARQKLVEGLASVGEWELAFAVRQRFLI